MLVPCYRALSLPLHLIENGLFQKWLELAAKQRVAEESEASESETEESEQNVSCFTCGHEVNIKNAIRHMARCFSKVRFLCHRNLPAPFLFSSATPEFGTRERDEAPPPPLLHHCIHATCCVCRFVVLFVSLLSPVNFLSHRIYFQFEGQTTYGSAFKTSENMYNLFCDEYNASSKTYCKRLRVICPEHAKDPKVVFFLTFCLLLSATVCVLMGLPQRRWTLSFPQGLIYSLVSQSVLNGVSS